MSTFREFWTVNKEDRVIINHPTAGSVETDWEEIFDLIIMHGRSKNYAEKHNGGTRTGAQSIPDRHDQSPPAPGSTHGPAEGIR